MNNKIKILLLGGVGKKTVSFNPSGDSYLYDGTFYPDTNYSSAAVLQLRGISDNQRNTIVKFDVSSLAGKTIITAKLKFYLAAVPGGDATISIHNLLAANSDMVFAQMTWNVRKTGTAWAGSKGCNTSGTDFNATAIATFDIVSGAAAGTLYEVALTPSVITGWTTANYGVVLQSNNTTTLHQLHSNETLTTTMKPVLEVTYK